MNKFVFRFLVFLMSLSLLGIILVQVYWFNTSLEKSEDEFKFHVKQVLGNVSEKLQKKEQYAFYNRYNQVRDRTGKTPQKEDLLEYGYYQRNAKTNETIVYSNSIIAEDYDVFSTIFDKNTDTTKIKSYSAKRKTEIYTQDNIFDDQKVNSDKFTINNVISSQQALIVKIVLENGKIVTRKVVL